MNLKYKEITLNESLSIIESKNYCHVGLCFNNKPYIIPMNYKVFKQDNIYYIVLTSLKNCKKMDIITNNRFVNINIQEVLNDGVFSIMCYGIVTKIETLNQYVNNIFIKLDYVTGRVISSNLK